MIQQDLEQIIGIIGQKKALLSKCKSDIGDLKRQLEFLMSEFKTAFAKTLRMIVLLVF